MLYIKKLPKLIFLTSILFVVAAGYRFFGEKNAGKSDAAFSPFHHADADAPPGGGGGPGGGGEGAGGAEGESNESSCTCY